MNRRNDKAMRCRFAFLLLGLALLTACADRPLLIPLITGTVWQPTNNTIDPRGNWQYTGAT